MCQIAFTVPDEVLYDIRMSDDDALAFARGMTALAFYTKSGVSIGWCAQIADMSEEDFMRFLGENEVSVFEYASKDELAREAALVS